MDSLKEMLKLWRKISRAIYSELKAKQMFKSDTNCAIKSRNCRNSMIFVVLYIFCLIIGFADSAQYIAPGDCTWNHIPQTSFDVSLKCHLRTISTNGLNFSLIQSEHTISLVVICDESQIESHLENGSLSHLRFLKSLEIENCKLRHLSGGALNGLQQLRNLTVRTHNNQWTITSLDLSHESVSNLKHLEKLDLGFNYMAQLPQDLFCPLTSLKTLNLTHNRLSGFGSFGLIDAATGQLCLQELQRLDLSFNDISFLSETGVASLKSLQILELQNNRISELAELSFSALKKLNKIDLSANKLETIPSRTFRQSEELKELHLQNNSLSVLPAGLFSGLSKLLILDVSHNLISSDWIFPETFADLIRVVVLNLGYNRIKTINGSTFQNQYSLQILYLNNNEIETIEDNSFASLYNLHTLILTGNRLKTVHSFTFNGLYVLSELSLAENEISRVDNNAFKNCSNLQDLNLSGNILSEIPKAVSSLRSLKILFLSDNEIKSIGNTSLSGLSQLSVVRLSGNRLSNLTRGILKELPSLRKMDLSSNRINSLDHGVFDDAPTLQTISLEKNLLNDINGLFMNLNNLHFLNVSNNKITWFDYALIPRSLIKLDVHNNEIETLGNYFELESALQLKEFDVSHNLIKEISGSAIPNRIERINLSENRIRVIHQFSFMAKNNITFVDLRNNSLQSLDINAFRLKALSVNRQSPEFYVSSNPYYCDCTMEWLQRINQLDTTSRQYPRIVDLESVSCQLPFVKHNQLVPLSKANPSNFLCKYKSHCFALCHCCDFDACDCEMMCPDNCTCYYDQSWNTNIVDCSQSTHLSVPQRIPMDVTELYLDGNHIPALSSHAFIGRKNLKVLHLNESHIEVINNRTFNGLKSLQVLNLNHNRLSQLYGYEFEILVDLKELYLSYNRIAIVANNTFLALKSLQTLHLDHNYIIEFQVWNLNFNTRLMDSRLAHNMWSCECQFVEQFIDWLPSRQDLIRDANQIQCFFNETTALPLLGQYNMSVCTNISVRNAVNNLNAENYVVSDYWPLAIIGSSVFLLLLVLVIVIFIYRREMSVWFYLRYGVRLEGRAKHRREEEKLFDAFVSYSKKDEAFVAQILAPELEYGNPPIRLCLHYRDLPVASGYLSDAIVEAMEASRRTILVISENFLKSEWCRYEFKSAHHQVLRTNRHKLILIFIGRIATKDLDPDIRLWLKTNTFLQWGEKMFWEKLRYALPDVPYTRKPADQIRDMTVAVHV